MIRDFIRERRWQYRAFPPDAPRPFGAEGIYVWRPRHRPPSPLDQQVVERMVRVWPAPYDWQRNGDL